MVVISHHAFSKMVESLKGAQALCKKASNTLDVLEMLDHPLIHRTFCKILDFSTSLRHTHIKHFKSGISFF